MKKQNKFLFRNFCFFFFIAFSTCIGQKTKTKLVAVDHFGDFYKTKNATLTKSNSKQSFKFNYQSKGQLTSIDTSNPMEVLLYFQAFQQLLVLDDQLNLIHEYTLPIFTTHFCNARNNRVWLYNSFDNVLELYNLERHQIEKTSLPLNLVPHRLYNQGNAIVTQNKDELQYFNSWGKLEETIALKKEYLHPSLSTKGFLYKKADSIYLNQQALLKHADKVDSLFIHSDKIYLIKSNKIKQQELPKKSYF